VQLTGRRLLRAVRDAVDHQAARAADALTAVVVEGHRVVAVEDQLLVEHIEHLEERHVGRDLGDVVRHHLALLVLVPLPPDPQGQVHHL
jgi:hypothetical protein